MFRTGKQTSHYLCLKLFDFFKMICAPLFRGRDYQPVRLLVSVKAYQSANNIFLSQQTNTRQTYQPRNLQPYIISAHCQSVAERNSVGRRFVIESRIVASCVVENPCAVSRKKFRFDDSQVVPTLLCVRFVVVGIGLSGVPDYQSN